LGEEGGKFDDDQHNENKGEKENEIEILTRIILEHHLFSRDPGFSEPS
jgi:hypothetical protein